jgi:putative radical SAM-modified peptide
METENKDLEILDEGKDDTEEVTACCAGSSARS